MFQMIRHRISVRHIGICEYRPSPLGRVAERSEVGRGIKNCYVIWITTACTPLLSCLRHATFPNEEGFGCGVKQLDKLGLAYLLTNFTAVPYAITSAAFCIMAEDA